MRNMISKLVAAVALVAASAAPAMACGGLFGSGCSPCGGQAYVSPCGGYGSGYGYGYGGVAAEVLPDPSRYYYANQGPSFSGPGNYAPYPTYRETALGGYARPNYGQYDGGGYGYSAGYSYAEPGYSFRSRVRPSYRYGYRLQPRHYGHSLRYGYHQPRHYAAPRVTYGQHYAAPRHAYPHYNARPQRRMY